MCSRGAEFECTYCKTPYCTVQCQKTDWANGAHAVHCAASITQKYAKRDRDGGADGADDVDSSGMTAEEKAVLARAAEIQADVKKRRAELEKQPAFNLAEVARITKIISDVQTEIKTANETLKSARVRLRKAVEEETAARYRTLSEQDKTAILEFLAGFKKSYDDTEEINAEWVREDSVDYIAFSVVYSSFNANDFSKALRLADFGSFSLAPDKYSNDVDETDPKKRPSAKVDALLKKAGVSLVLDPTRAVYSETQGKSFDNIGKIVVYGTALRSKEDI